MKNHRPLAYVASPYSHKDPQVMEERFLAVCRASAKLMSKGLTVFSPISHCHPIKQVADLPHTWEFWMHIDKDFLSVSHTLYVLKLDGWKTSVGVAAEIKIAKEMGIKIKYLKPEEPAVESKHRRVANAA